MIQMVDEAWHHISLIVLRDHHEDHLAEICIAAFLTIGILLDEYQDTIAIWTWHQVKIIFEIILEEISFLELEVYQPLFLTLIKILPPTLMMGH